MAAGDSHLARRANAARSYVAPALTIRGREFRWGSRTYVMGIINVTPDSFSGDGLDGDIERAVTLAKRMETDGADWLDIGGESSRPGAQELDPGEELRRVVPAVEAIRAQTSLPISVDTYHAAVARAALKAGADAINDIWGLRHDPEMARVIAEAGAVVIAMHNQRGRQPGYVTRLVREGLQESLRICREHGIRPARVILDPGFGFGWAPEENLRMIAELGELAALNYPLLVGTSRKSTIGHVLGDVPVDQRLMGTAATVAIAITNGADIIRVHDVKEMVQVAKMADAVAGRGAVAPRTRVVIALGSNLGDRLGNLRAAMNRLEQKHGLAITAKSSVWQTAPVPADQPAFLNAAILAETSLEPLRLLAALKEVEHAFGRRPERRWGPRPIDLDLLFYGQTAVDLPELTIPHPRILERNFVLAPLAEVMPGELPILRGTATAALAAVGTEGLRRFAGL
ncbi:MAG: dihydropteroate synthase [Dehalococcoidia bacterium]